MAELTLYIGNRNYSSWSLRPWLAMKMAGLAFTDIVIPLDEPTTHERILRYSPSGRVPVLFHGEYRVWESLAICEYVAELAPQAKLWPAEPWPRAVARALACEMHSGFAALRRHMPMNVRSRFPGKGRERGVRQDINRVAAIWRGCRARFGEREGGPYLFGHFTVVDAMFAPVATRFRTYDVTLEAEEQAYADAVLSLPPMLEWAAAAEREPMIIDSAEF